MQCVFLQSVLHSSHLPASMSSYIQTLYGEPLAASLCRPQKILDDMPYLEPNCNLNQYPYPCAISVPYYDTEIVHLPPADSSMGWFMLPAKELVWRLCRLAQDDIVACVHALPLSHHPMYSKQSKQNVPPCLYITSSNAVNIYCLCRIFGLWWLSHVHYLLLSQSATYGPCLSFRALNILSRWSNACMTLLCQCSTLGKVNDALPNTCMQLRREIWRLLVLDSGPRSCLLMLGSNVWMIMFTGQSGSQASYVVCALIYTRQPRPVICLSCLTGKPCLSISTYSNWLIHLSSRNVWFSLPPQSFSTCVSLSMDCCWTMQA